CGGHSGSGAVRYRRDPGVRAAAVDAFHLRRSPPEHRDPLCPAGRAGGRMSVSALAFWPGIRYDVARPVYERSVCCMAEFTYEITERIAVLSTNARGWERQLNMISWNGNPPKYDIRDWSPDGSRMAKGISLTAEELKSLRDILNDLEL